MIFFFLFLFFQIKINGYWIFKIKSKPQNPNLKTQMSSDLEMANDRVMDVEKKGNQCIIFWTTTLFVVWTTFGLGLFLWYPCNRFTDAYTMIFPLTCAFYMISLFFKKMKHVLPMIIYIVALYAIISLVVTVHKGFDECPYVTVAVIFTYACGFLGSLLAYFFMFCIHECMHQEV